MTAALIKFECSATCIVEEQVLWEIYVYFSYVERGKHMFQKNPRKIIYCFDTYQPLYDDMKRDIDYIEFHEGLPTKEDMDIWSFKEGLKILILDDLAQKASESIDIANLFTIYSHHKNFSVFFIVQNLYMSENYLLVNISPHSNTLYTMRTDIFPRQTLVVLCPENEKYE